MAAVLSRQPLSVSIDVYRNTVSLPISAHASVADVIEQLFATGTLQRDDGFVLGARMSGLGKVNIYSRVCM